MHMIVARLRSISFYAGLLACFVYSHEMKSKHLRQMHVQQAQVNAARVEIKRIQALDLGKCSDGWASSSHGPGTCSWHGGINYNWQRELSTLQMQASSDPETRYRNKVASTNLITALLVALVVWLSPALDSIFGNPYRGKKLRAKTKSIAPEQQLHATTKLVSESPDAFMQYYSLTHEQAEEQLRGVRKAIKERIFRACELATSGKHEKSQLLRDPLEHDPVCGPAIRKAQEYAEAECDKMGLYERGRSQETWKIQEEIIRTKHGLQWYSPSQMNPETYF